MTGIVTARTVPYEYETSTDEFDALALNVVPDLTGTEAVTAATCELRTAYTRENATDNGFPQLASVASNVVTQQFDARGLAPGHYEWVWNVTLNTGAIRSYESLLKVRNHD